jgi:hypothetical protein
VTRHYADAIISISQSRENAGTILFVQKARKSGIRHRAFTDMPLFVAWDTGSRKFSAKFVEITDPRAIRPVYTKYSVRSNYVGILVEHNVGRTAKHLIYPRTRRMWKLVNGSKWKPCRYSGYLYRQALDVIMSEGMEEDAPVLAVKKHGLWTVTQSRR